MSERVLTRSRAPSEAGPDLTIRGLWEAFRSESWAFYVLMFYVIWEYWRPQSMYRALDVIPWGRVTVAAAVVAFFLGGERARSLRLMDALVLGFAVWVYATIPFGFAPQWSWDFWAGMVTWVVMFLLVSHMVTTPRRLLVFWFCIFGIFFKMSQHGASSWAMRGFSFADYGVSGAPVWFANSGELAMGMVIFLAMSWCFLTVARPRMKPWLYWGLVAAFPVTAIMTILASSSRGGQLAALVVIVLMALWNGVRVRTLVVFGLALTLSWQFLPQAQKDRFAIMGTEEDTTGQARLIHWENAIEVIKDRPIFGLGYENWIPWYATQAPIELKVVHNTYLEAGSELGIPGALLFLTLIGTSFVVNHQTRRRSRRIKDWGEIFSGMAAGLDFAMVGMMVASFFMSVLFWPVYWMAFALTTGLSVTSQRSASRQRAEQRVPRELWRGAPVPQRAAAYAFGRSAPVLRRTASR